MERATRAELKAKIRELRKLVTDYEEANDQLAERVQRLARKHQDALAQRDAVARRCAAALNALDEIARNVHSERSKVAGA